MNRLNRGFDLTSTGLSLTLLFVCVGVGYNFVDNSRQGPSYGQMTILGALATQDEMKHNPLLQARAHHCMLWIYDRTN